MSFCLLEVLVWVIVLQFVKQFGAIHELNWDCKVNSNSLCGTWNRITCRRRERERELNFWKQWIQIKSTNFHFLRFDLIDLICYIIYIKCYLYKWQTYEIKRCIMYFLMYYNFSNCFCLYYGVFFQNCVYKTVLHFGTFSCCVNVNF